MAEEKKKDAFADYLEKCVRSLRERDHLAHSASLESDEEVRRLYDILEIKSSRHRHYRHYLGEDRARQILSERAIYLTDGSSWNDKFDRDRFNPSLLTTKKRFGACMSYSSSENIAMWMLYGGRDGKGAMIDFDEKTLKSAKYNAAFECGYFDKGDFVPCEKLDSKDVIFSLVDVSYFRLIKDGDMAFEMKRSAEGERWVGVTEELWNTMSPLSKHESWSFEQEVRFVASINRDALGKHPSRIKCIRIPLQLEDNFEDERVFSSPISDGGSFRDSELSGTVDWDLCKGCSYKRP